MLRALLALLLLTALAPVPAPAAAQDDVPHVEPPPDPQDRDPSLLVSASLGYVGPLERTNLCPGGASCVLGPGGLIEIEVERRWPFGLGIFLGYNVWFVESGGVFELGTAQVIRAGLRVAFFEDLLLHPTLHLGAGALVFGDTLLVSTVGGALDVGATAELELTEDVEVTAGAKAWVFTTSPFTTERDDIARAEGLGLNVAVQLSLGITILALAEAPGP